MATNWTSLLTSPGRKKVAKDIDAAAKSVAASTGVPEDLLRASVTALAAKESGFDPKVKNEIGAAGLLQYIPATAKARGIDPLNPKQSILAATQDAAEAFKRGGVAEIAASHFAGAGGTGRGPKTREYVRDFLEGLTHLNAPAHRYATARPKAAPATTPKDVNPFEVAASAAPSAPPPMAPAPEDANPFAAYDSAPSAAPAAALVPSQYDDPIPTAPRLAGADTNPFGGYDVKRDPRTLNHFQSLIEGANA